MSNSWQDIQKRSLEVYSLSGPRQIEQHRQVAEKWSHVLQQAGFVIPLFVVLDVGGLLVQADRWNRFSKPPPPGLDQQLWQTYQHRYWGGLRLIKIILQKHTPLSLPFYEPTNRSDRVIPFLIISVLFFLKWLDRKNATSSYPKVNSFLKHYSDFLQWQEKKSDLSAKEKQAYWEQEVNLLAKILDDRNFQYLEKLLKNPDEVDDFLRAPSINLAAWHWALESNWRKKRQTYGSDYAAYLDDHCVRKYLENFPNTYATNLLQQLNIVSSSASILPTRSKRYTSFEEITPFGYSINPTELIYVSDQATEDYFWSRWAEESLLKLDSNTPEENPTEFHINFVIPDLPEMELLTLADDEQIFSSYAKYLTLLLWHDFLYLYVDSGCSTENHFFFSLFLARLDEEKRLKEQAYSIAVDEEWIDKAAPFMIKMQWVKGTASAMDSAGTSVFDPFYRIPLDHICKHSLAETPSPAPENPFQHGQRGQYWTLFLPESTVLKASKNVSSALENIYELKRDSRVTQILNQKDRRYQHVILIGFGKVELYRVQFGHQISLMRLSRLQGSRKEQEQELRQILIDHYLNHILMPIM